MNRPWLGLVAILIGVTSACDESPKQKAEVPDEEPQMAVIEALAQRPQLAETDPAGGEPADFATWPGQGEGMTFDLMWLGGDEAIELREAPDQEAAVVATASWLDGEQFEWTGSRVHVDEPRPYTVEVDRELTGLPYDAEFLELEADEQRVELQEGESVYLYQYGGEGACYMGVGSKILLAQCPDEAMSVDDDSDLDDAEWKPLSQQWWVQVHVDGEDKGWFPVHDAPVEVHLRSVEGYDDFDDDY